MLNNMAVIVYNYEFIIIIVKSLYFIFNLKMIYYENKCYFIFHFLLSCNFLSE